MPLPDDPPKKLVINDAVLKAFIDGGLEPSIEQKVAAYLDARPELLAKIASHSGEVFLDRLKTAKQQSIASNSNAVPVNQIGGAADAKLEPSSLSVSSSIPTVLANYAAYQITKELGRGGMGVVYLAKNVQMDRLEVLKVLNEKLLDHEGAKERFLREVRAVSKLNHPNIVTSYSILPLDQLMVFAMEYVHGMDLHKFIHKHKPLPIGLACSFARQMALGLQHAHEKGLVHRDIKPSNAIVYKADGQLQLKILDFGLAKATSEKQSDGLTQDGTMLGTPEYMSPEQMLNASKADIRADIYSLGCTLYTMLTSSPPFTGTHGEIMMAHAQREATTANLRRPEVPTELATIVAKMMAKDVDKRYQVPGEVATALQPFLGKNYGVSKGQPAATLEATGTVNELKAQDRETSVEKQRDLSLDYARVDGESPVLSFEEILKRPKPAATQLRGTKRQTKSRRSKNGWWFAIVANLILLPLTLWMAGVFSVNTPDGTIVFDKLPKDAGVFVDGNKVQVTWNEGKDEAKVSIVPGTHQVKVVDGERTSTGEKVTISSGQEYQLEVRWANRQLPQVSNDTANEGATSATEKSDNFSEVVSGGKSLLNRQLLLNPGNEEPLINGRVAQWKSDQVGWFGKPMNGSDTPAQYGKRYFAAMESATAELYQAVDVSDAAAEIDARLMQVKLSGVTRSWKADVPDLSEVVLECISVDKSSHFFSATKGKLKTIDEWKRFELSAPLPSGTRYLKVLLRSERRQGRSNDGYFDDLSLTLEQLNEPERHGLEDRVSIAALPTQIAKTPSSREGFVPLWNGKDMTGWHFPFGRGTYTVTDGILDAKYSRTNYQAIVTDRDDFSNFHSRWQMRIDSGSLGGNSNVQFFLRTKQNSEELSGWEFALGGKRAAAAGVAPLGAFKLKTGGLPASEVLQAEPGKPENDLIVTGETLPPMSRDEWHSVEFFARGNRVDMVIDGKLVTSVVDSLDRISAGQLALRAQWDTRIEFKSIDIKEFASVGEANSYADLYLASLSLQAGSTVSHVDATWSPIFVDGKLAKNTSVYSQQFSTVGGVLTHTTDTDALLFGTESLRDFRVRLEYRLTEEAEAALILRCPNARKERETGYSIGLGNTGWIYNIHKAFHFIHMSARAKKILDVSDSPGSARVSENDWHTMEVEAIGSRISAALDGKRIYSFEDSEHLVGVIGIQSRRSGLEVRRFEYQVIK